MVSHVSLSENILLAVGTGLATFNQWRMRVEGLETNIHILTNYILNNYYMYNYIYNYINK